MDSTVILQDFPGHQGARNSITALDPGSSQESTLRSYITLGDTSHGQHAAPEAPRGPPCQQFAYLCDEAGKLARTCSTQQHLCWEVRPQNTWTQVRRLPALLGWGGGCCRLRSGHVVAVTKPIEGGKEQGNRSEGASTMPPLSGLPICPDGRLPCPVP